MTNHLTAKAQKITGFIPASPPDEETLRLEGSLESLHLQYR